MTQVFQALSQSCLLWGTMCSLLVLPVSHNQGSGSPDYCLASFLDIVIKRLAIGVSVCGELFLYLTKVFDTVDFDVLL